MNDRGEKIVTLAQEMLRSGDLDVPKRLNNKNNKSERNVALKAACLAAVVSATGSAALTHIIHENNRPATRYEVVEIDALVFYTARELDIAEKHIREEVNKAVGLSAKTVYSVSDYRRARKYLWLRLKDYQ
ncbi:MAG TPA: hypothetical protein DD400_05435 [Rhodospirillaceae bacterium]|nr:hypothetical protein [Rhodospirillaceae bacterium]